MKRGPASAWAGLPLPLFSGKARRWHGVSWKRDCGELAFLVLSGLALWLLSMDSALVLLAVGAVLTMMVTLILLGP